MTALSRPNSVGEALRTQRGSRSASHFPLPLKGGEAGKQVSNHFPGSTWEALGKHGKHLGWRTLNG